jgi:hypothetical protein
VHFLVQALIAGAAALLPFAASLAPAAGRPLLEIVAGGTALHLLLVWSEAALPHATAHARLAAREMTAGRYRAPFRWGVWLGVLAVAAAVLAPALIALVACPSVQLASGAVAACGAGTAAGPGGWLAAALALAALLAYEHAYVQAGQCVPLA